VQNKLTQTTGGCARGLFVRMQAYFVSLLASLAEEFSLTNTAGKINVQSAGPRTDWTACPVTCLVARFGRHDAVTVTGGATENKEDKNLYKQVIRLLKN
jgi:hypothetical protein